MAKTFDLDDPAGYMGYLKESMVQMTLYGDIRMTLGTGREITIHDGKDRFPDPVQPGWQLVMDDGSVLPVPEAAS